MAKPTSPPSAPTGSSATIGNTGTGQGSQGGAGDGIKQQASELAHTAQEKVQTQVEGQKQRATEALSGVGDALHKVGDTLRESDQDMLAQYADAAAEQLEAFTRSLRNRSVGDLLDEAERFARREPALFIGGAFLLGVFGARFIKASAPDRFARMPPYGSGYGPGYGMGGRSAYGAGPAYGTGRHEPGRAMPGRAGAPGNTYEQPPHRVLHTAGGEMPAPSNPARTPDN